jgi:hypothetical protein
MQRGRFAVIRGFSCVVLFSIAGNSHNSLCAQAPSDESGTLVMVARAIDMVVVSVDSKVTHNAGDAADIAADPVDGKRKLVQVGEKSSCAISGFIGNNTEELDVSASLRKWVENHPKTEAHDALLSLLQESAGAWDRQNYVLGKLPLNRHIGSNINTLTCGDVVNGHPVIVRGQTIVRPDGRGGQNADYRILPSQNDDLLYVSGYINTNPLINFLANPSLVNQEKGQPAFESDAAIITELTNNPMAMAAFSALRDSHYRAVRDSKPEQPPAPSTWASTNIQDLFTSVFAAVEAHSPDVAPPNNVSLIRPCGRFQTTVEGNWPSCPTHRITKKKH